jgi:hypothetical protein
MAILLWLFACVPAGRTCADDGDCDGVPDVADRCARSSDEPTDAAGCTDDQMAGCAVELDAPAHHANVRGATTFAWRGTCDVYLLQFSHDAAFPAGATRTEARTAEPAFTTVSAERYWRVVGGRAGRSRGFTTEPREIRWY